MMKQILPPFLWIIVFELVSATIGYTTNTAPNMAWYDSLEKSALTPPDILFPVMWTTLYALIALAGYFSWINRTTPAGKAAFSLFVTYMILNWSWSFVFFNAHLVFSALILLVIIDLTALVFILRVWSPSRISAYLMLPSVLWTGFATFLTFEIWHLNA